MTLGDKFADDPLALFDVDRYATASTAAIRLSGSSHQRYWDPADPSFVDFAIAFDVEHEPLMPGNWFPELESLIASGLDDARQTALGNEIMRWLMSGILHGEQASMYLAAQLCTGLSDPAEQEFAANQSREEARHVAALTRYIASRWRRPYPIGQVFGRWLCDLMRCPRSAPKIVGMSLLLEGFAMGAFSNIRTHTRDGVLKTLMMYLLRDEAAHHNFGLWWLKHHAPSMTAAERRELSDWALRGFVALYVNLVSVRQRKAVYERFELDWTRVRDAVRERRRTSGRPLILGGDVNPILVMAKALDQGAVLTADAKSRLSSWLENSTQRRGERS